MKRFWRKSKKGVTLIELIAVISIMTVVMAAALVALYTGSKSATDGAGDYANHGDAYLLETWLRKNLPTASKLNVKNEKETSSGFLADLTEVLNLYFSADGNFVIEKRGKGSVMQVSGIQKVVLQTDDVGENEKLHYEITAGSGGRSFILSGGIVLNNVKKGTYPVSPVTLTQNSSYYINIAK